MRFLAVVLLLVTSRTAWGQTPSLDFVSSIRSAADSGRSIGFHKLSAVERGVLNTYLNNVYQSGFSAGLAQSAPATPQVLRGPGSYATSVATTTAFKTRIDSVRQNVLALGNGAVVEVSAPFARGFSPTRDAVLLRSGSGCSIWILGDRLYRCSPRRDPRVQGVAGVEGKLRNISRSGDMLVLEDGSIFDVSSMSRVTTGVWSRGASVLILNDSEIVNLDAGDAILAVTRLR